MPATAFVSGLPLGLRAHARPRVKLTRLPQVQTRPRAGLPSLPILPPPATSPLAAANIAAGAATNAAAPVAATAAAGAKTAADAVAGAAATADAVVNSTGETFGDQGQVARYLAFFVFLQIVAVTIGSVLLTYQNWVLRRNGIDSEKAVAARLAQFGGPDKVEPQDHVFATIKGAAGKGIRKPWPKGVYPGKIETGRRRIAKSSSGSDEPPSAASRTSRASDYEGNRDSRRRQMKGERRDARAERQAAPASKLKDPKGKVVEESEEK
jgi:hypothetical protein